MCHVARQRLADTYLEQEFPPCTWRLWQRYETAGLAMKKKKEKNNMKATSFEKVIVAKLINVIVISSPCGLPPMMVHFSQKCLFPGVMLTGRSSRRMRGHH